MFDSTRRGMGPFKTQEMFIFLIIALCFPVALGQMSVFGSCPAVSAVQDFQPLRFSGLWYEIERFRTFPYSLFRSSCKTVEFDYDDDSNAYDVTFQSYSFFFGLDTLSATAIIKDPDEREGVLTLNLPGRLTTSTTAFNYYVLATDYENYAVVSMCRNTRLFTQQNLWILSRKRTLDNDMVILARLHAYAQKFNVFALSRTEQTICPLIK